MQSTSDSTYHFRGRERPASRAQRLAARKSAEQDAHGIVVGVIGPEGRVPLVVREHFPAWWTDLRRKQNTIYGALLRFIDVSIMAGVPRKTLKVIPRIIDAYIDDCYEDVQPVDLGEAA